MVRYRVSYRVRKKNFVSVLPKKWGSGGQKGALVTSVDFLGKTKRECVDKIPHVTSLLPVIFLDNDDLCV